MSIATYSFVGEILRRFNPRGFSETISFCKKLPLCGISGKINIPRKVKDEITNTSLVNLDIPLATIVYTFFLRCDTVCDVDSGYIRHLLGRVLCDENINLPLSHTIAQIMSLHIVNSVNNLYQHETSNPNTASLHI